MRSGIREHRRDERVSLADRNRVQLGEASIILLEQPERAREHGISGGIRAQTGLDDQ